jgi:predicted AAA+ superfamily ATPase
VAVRRYLQGQTLADLDRRMVFIAGPRQVGKTTFARALPGARAGYLNWDVAPDRERILKRTLPTGTFWAFDEIHKFRGWRNYLKGLWDGRPAGQRLLVTGSARLDFYRFGGDSLQGRYHLLRMHPLSVAELGLSTAADWRALQTLGGFPEPFFSGSAREAKRWSTGHRTRLIRDELTSLERVDDLGRLELLALRLPELVGAPLSINSLREDLEVSHKTLARWVSLLERLYALMLVRPFGSPRVRAIKKIPKHYHLDWTLPPAPGASFENLVAVHLLKWVHWRQDVEGLDLELRYFRDVDGREVDFVVTDRRKPVLIVECKLDDGPIDPSVRYLKAKFPDAAAWQVHAQGAKDYQTSEGIRVAPALALLKTLI